MKVVFIQPPVQDFYGTDIRLQPIGLCYLKAAIRKYLPEVEVIVKDYHSGYGRRTIPIPEDLSYLSEYYPVADKSPFSTFHQYYHFGQSFDMIETEIKDMSPDAVGISSLFTPYYREALEVAKRVKRQLDVPVIMGGSHVSEVPEFVLSQSSVDYVVRGEGERPVVEFIRYLLGHVKREDVPNLGYKTGDKLYFNPIGENYPVDELPMPDLSDLFPERYQFARKRLAFMITSRGCPHKCSFCSVHTTFGDHYRRRSTDNVIKEIEQRYEEGYRVIDFEDDNLTFHKNEFRELCLRLIEMFPAHEMEFTAMNGISYMSLDNELLELMHNAGFSHLNLALVSSGNDILNAMMRPHSLDAYVQVINKAIQLGFKIVSYQILGLPDEKLSGMVSTLAFHSRLPVLIGPSPFYLVPKSPIAKEIPLSEQDYVKARLTAMAVETGSFKREDIYTLLITTRIINFLKGLQLSESTEINKLLNQQWRDRRIHMGIEILKDLEQYRTLKFWTSKGKIQNNKFKTELFQRVLREAEYIACQDGRHIAMDSFLNN